MAVKSVVGEVMMYTNITPPSGWLICDGSAISRTTYADLFAVCGVTYGLGNGSTTFNIPNLTGKFVVGSGSGAGYTQGSVGGTDSLNVSLAQIPSHTHSYSTSSGKTGVTGSHTTGGTIAVGNNSANHTHGGILDFYGTFEYGGTVGPFNMVHNPASGSALTRTTSSPQSFATGTTVTNETSHNWTSSASPSHTHSATITGGGSDVAHENKPPFLQVTYLIKY
jgi:microcystin-dependent protein